MSRDLAILAGEGELPVILADYYPQALFITVTPDAPVPEGREVLPGAVHRIGSLFEDLKSRDIARIVMAGSMTRPDLRSVQPDAFTANLLPEIAQAMKSGDDALLRFFIGLFEQQGLHVVGAAELLPDLVAKAGLIAGREPSRQEMNDADRAAAILRALAPLDVGQAAVVADGLCLGIETIAGTDALIASVAALDPALRRGSGVLVKIAKRGQDMRVDMPVVGPATIRNAAGAGLAGIILSAGSVMIVNREETERLANEAGLFILAR